jgi:recombination protein O
LPLFTADALILRTYKLGEADRIVVFLTRDRGKKRGVAKGARRPRSKFVGALEPLSEVRVAYFEKEQRELVGLNYAETVRSPLSMVGPADRLRHGDGGPPKLHAKAEAGHDEHKRQAGHDEDKRNAGHDADADIDALGYVGYFAELLDEWAQDADADDRLYRLGASMLDALAAKAPVEPLARYFEYWLLRLQGVYPESRGTLSTGALAFLAASRSVAPHRVGEVRAEERVLKELENAHRALITMHLEKTLKSDRVLRDLRRHG